jgi:molecular chaperone DnaJ
MTRPPGQERRRTTSVTGPAPGPAGWQAKTTDTVKRAAQAIRPAVRRAIIGLRTMMTVVRRQVRRRSGRRRGADLRYNMEITLEEAFSGKSTEVRIPAKIICQTCDGRGRVARTKCSTCDGRGSTMRERVLSVIIPPGVEGTQIRLAGEGEAPLNGGSSGDLYIFIMIVAHTFFNRIGTDLHCKVPISAITAALGGEFEMRAIDGRLISVKVPKGTQSGQRLRLQAEGMPVLRSKQKGDMYVQLVVEMQN